MTNRNWQMPRISREEFVRKAENFIDVYPSPEHDPTGVGAAAVEIVGMFEGLDSDRLIDGWDWVTNYTKFVSKEAAMLGAAILQSDSSANPDRLTIEMKDVPSHYRLPLEEFMDQFIYIMSVGEGKGYRVWNTLHSYDWMGEEAKNKIEEAKEDLFGDNPDPEHAARALAKVATAAFCLFTAYTYYTGLPKWFTDGKLDHRAIQLLDETSPEDC